MVPISVLPPFYFLLRVFVCVVCVCLTVHVWRLEGKLWELVLSCQMPLNAGHWAWWQVTLMAESSYWPPSLVYSLPLKTLALQLKVNLFYLN